MPIWLKIGSALASDSAGPGAIDLQPAIGLVVPTAGCRRESQAVVLGQDLHGAEVVDRGRGAEVLLVRLGNAPS